MIRLLAGGGHPSPGQSSAQWLDSFGLSFLLDFAEGCILENMDAKERTKFDKQMDEAATYGKKETYDEWLDRRKREIREMVGMVNTNVMGK